VQYKIVFAFYLMMLLKLLLTSLRNSSQTLVVQEMFRSSEI